jgi:hypothetical protein
MSKPKQPILIALSAVLVAALAVVGGVPAQSAEAPPKPGATCPKAGIVWQGGGVTFKCVKKGKKLVWQKVKGGGSGGGGGSQGQPQLGTPCTKAGQIWSGPTMGIACTPKDGKLVWMQIDGGQPCVKEGDSWEGAGMKFVCTRQTQGLVWIMQGSGGGGGGGYANQPVPADGKWQVPEGYPDDMPPMGWTGEPSWFISNWDVLTAQSIGPECPQYPFTHLPTDVAALDSITGQGFMQPGAHNLPVPHMYYNTGSPTSVTKDPKGVAYVSEVVDVYAPGDMTLRGLVKQTVTRDGATFLEYMISFSVCENLWWTTAHIDEVNPVLLAAAEKSPLPQCGGGGQQADAQNCTYYYLRQPIKAGTLIGKASGRAHGFDFGATDTRAPVSGKLDPGAFSPRWAAGVCGLDYFTPALRSQLEAKVSGNNGCGQLVSDVAGTAAGVWLAEGKRQLSQTEDLHIALAKHWSTKGDLVMSIGTETGISGLPSAAYQFTPSTSGNNRAFWLVKPGEVVCYDALRSIRGGAPGPTVYITMTTGAVEKIQIVGTSGSCPSGALTMPSGAKTFERRNTLT